MEKPSQGSQMLNLNGRTVEIYPGETVLQIANRNGITIPTLCYDPRITCSGHCKVCLVEVNGSLRPSCVEKAESGMAVVTHSVKALEARKKRVSAILKKHKGNCQTCLQLEFCGLLDLSELVGLGRPVFTSEAQPLLEVIQNKIQIDFDKCISCGKCVRVCSDIRKVGALRHPVLSPDVDRITYDNTCEECGQCAVICPTGAIVEIYRTQSSKRVKSVCTFCATGCNIYLDVSDNKIVGVTSDESDQIGRGNLCVKGRFGFSFINHPDRIKTPLIRTDAGLKEVSWEEAFAYTSKKLIEIRDTHGPKAIGGIGSARATNEDNYLFQKFMRTAIGTNNIDNCARLCHMPAGVALNMALGISASSASIADIEHADVMLVVGSNTTEAHPISALHVKWAHARGARLIVIDPREIPLTRESDMHLQLRPGTNVALFNGMLRVMIEEEMIYPEFIENSTKGWNRTRETVFSLSLHEVEVITGVPMDMIKKAARIYGSSRRAMIVSGLGVDEHEYGTEGMLAVTNLALATGNIGMPGAGILCLRGQNNVQGVCDMGCLPGVLPGYQPVMDDEVRIKFSERWGRVVPDWIGLNSVQMWDAVLSQEIKALYIWGEDPAQTHGDSRHVRSALGDLGFLVYQDLFHTSTSEYADVILPVSSFAEKSGTFTNTERRVRLLRQAISPLADSRPDWEIFQELSNRLGYSSAFRNTAEIFDEMASLTPYFSGMSHKRVGSHGLQWPCKDERDPGTVRLYTDKFIGRPAKFSPVPYREPSEKITEDYPLILTTGRRLYHFNNSSQTRRTETSAGKKETLDMNPYDIKQCNLQDGQKVRIYSRRGDIEMIVRSAPSILRGTVFASFHLPQFPVNVLTGGARDTYTDTYSYKFTAVRVEGSD